MWTYLCVEKQCGQITVLVLPILTIKAHKVPLQVVLLARAVCPFYGGALLCERVRKCMHLCLYSHTCARARACVCVCACVWGKGKGGEIGVKCLQFNCKHEATHQGKKRWMDGRAMATGQNKCICLHCNSGAPPGLLG